MRVPGRQEGFLLIAAIALIVVLGFLGVVVSFLATSNLSAGTLHLTSGQAFYVAESGLERAKFGYMQERADCSELVYAGSVGKGAFSTTPTYYAPVSTSLSAAITDTDAVIPLTSTVGLAPAGRVRIDFEDVDYGSISGSSLVGVRRAQNGTLAVAHASGAAVSLDLCSVQSAGSVVSARRTVREALITPQAMMVYAKSNGDGTPYFRRWDGTAWSVELTANGVASDINYLVLKFARTRNEAILGTLSSTGAIYVQVWNGSAWGTPLFLADVGNGNDADHRSFDIAYESVSDRAVVVYNDNGPDPDYRIWDGTSWSAAGNIDFPTPGDVRWIELAAHPSENEIAMIAMDRTRRVYGMSWDGSAWLDMGVTGSWGRVDDDDFKAIAVAYEQQSGTAMFVWGEDSDDDQGWRTWDGSTLSGTNIMTINSMSGRARWIRLVPDFSPGSDNLMYVVQDEGDDLNTAFWNGSVWGGGHPEHDTSTEDGDDRNFDFVFETAVANRSTGWLLWGNGANVSARRWNGGGWDATISLGGDDTALIQMIALKKSGTLLAAAYEDSASASDDLYTFERIGGAGTVGSTLIWGGATVGNPVQERVVLGEERYIPEAAWEEVFP